MRKYWRTHILASLLVCSTLAAATTPSVSANATASTLARSLQSKNATEAAAAAYWLGFKGTSAVAEIPRLIAALGDDRPVKASAYRSDAAPNTRSSPGEEAAGALARIGKPAVDPLITALRASSNPVARRNAAWALGQIDTATHNSTTAATPPSQPDHP